MKLYMVESEKLFEAIFKLGFENLRGTKYYGFSSYEAMYDCLTGSHDFDDDELDRLVDLLEPRNKDMCYAEIVVEIFHDLV